MKTPLILAAALLVSLPPLASAAEGAGLSVIKMNSGKVYTNCRIFKTDPDGVIISHQAGGAKLLFAEMPENTRVMLGYDAKKEADYEKDRAEKRKKEREELWKYRCEVAKAQAAAYTAEARRLEVIAIQNYVGGGYGGYGYGLGDGLYGFGYGFGNPYGYGYGNRFGSPHHGYGHGHVNRGRYTFPNPTNGGTFNVKGHTHFGPQPRSAPLATPAMGPLTPALGGR